MRYTGIAETGNALADLLKKHLVPEVVKSPEQIGLCHPSDKGDCSVVIWIYDIRECEELRSHAMQSIDSVRQKYPSCFVHLFCMITAYSAGDIRYRAVEEQYILGKVLQVLKDYAAMDLGSGIEGGTGEKHVCSVSLQNLSMEEKIHICSIIKTNYRTSLFYEVGPVEIESERTKNVVRVKQVRFDVEDI